MKKEIDVEKAFMFFMEHCNDKPKTVSGLRIARELGLSVQEGNYLIGKYWDSKFPNKCTQCGAKISKDNDPQVCVDCYM